MIKDMPLLVFAGSTLECYIQLSVILILLNIRDKSKNLKFWISILILGFYATLSFLITDNVIRIILLFFLYIFLIEWMLKFNFKYLSKIILLTFFTWLINGFVDVLSYIFFIEILKIDMEAYRNNILLLYSNNFIILFLFVAIFSLQPIRKFAIKLTDIKLQKSTILIILFSAIMFSIMFYLCIFKYSYSLILIISFILVLVYTVITLTAIKVTNQKNKIQAEYDILLTNLSEYENLLDRQRISNHENKNQLLVIRGMIEKNEDAVKYIDSLIDTQYKVSDELIMKTNRIPSGGLKGLIYYKMLIMKDKKINVGLEVNSYVNKINFSNLSMHTNQQLCKIIGVFLDNAIEEVEKLNDKNINIIVDNEENNLIIKISNSYGYSNINSIGDKGYTSKGSGHGYGLRLVKSILDSNRLFSHKTEINGKVFSQIIKLKMTD